MCRAVASRKEEIAASVDYSHNGRWLGRAGLGTNWSACRTPSLLLLGVLKLVGRRRAWFQYLAGSALQARQSALGLDIMVVCHVEEGLIAAPTAADPDF